MLSEKSKSKYSDMPKDIQSKILRVIWLILKSTPIIKGITFFVLRNSRYFFWRYRGGKPIQLGPGNKKFLKDVINQIGDDKKFNLIEFGCAAGPSLIELAKNFPEAHFAGYDIRKGAIKDGCDYLEKNSIKNISLNFSNLTDISEEFNCDFLISRATLIYLSPHDLKELLLKIKYNIKRKIIFHEIHALTDSSEKHYFFAHPFKEILKDLGFEDLYNIKLEDMHFKPWKGRRWKGVCIVLERKNK